MIQDTLDALTKGLPNALQHSHDYALDSSSAQRRTRFVIAITATMMVVEIVAGIGFTPLAQLSVVLCPVTFCTSSSGTPPVDLTLSRGGIKSWSPAAIGDTRT